MAGVGALGRIGRIGLPGVSSETAIETILTWPEIVAWWNADRSDLITLSSGAISSWRDSKAGYDAVQGTSGSRPSWSATGFNGAPCAGWDGVDDFLTCTDAALLAALPDGAEPGEMWAVVQQDGLVADGAFRCAQSYGANAGTDSRLLYRHVTGGANRIIQGTGTGAASVGQSVLTVDFSSRHVIRGVNSATQETPSIDGVSAAALAAVPATLASRLRLGAACSSSAGTFWSGKSRDHIVSLPLPSDKAAYLQAVLASRRML